MKESQPEKSESTQKEQEDPRKKYLVELYILTKMERRLQIGYLISEKNALYLALNKTNFFCDLRQK